jgi:hypothetical protein
MQDRFVRNVAEKIAFTWRAETRDVKLQTGKLGNLRYAKLYAPAAGQTAVEIGRYTDKDRNLQRFAVVPPIKPGDAVAFQFATIGAVHAAWINGKFLGSVTDDIGIEAGRPSISAGEGVFDSYEYLPLDDLPEAEALKLVGVDSGTLSYGGHRYQFVPGQVTWEEAKTKAEAMGGHLATFTSKEEWEAVMNGLIVKQAVGRCWLGARRSADGSWAWITGEPWSFTAWAIDKSGAPNPSGISAGGLPEELLEFTTLNVFAPPGGWNDVSSKAKGNLPNQGFLVEWDDASGKKP